MHPVERLRYVAQAGDTPTVPLGREAAYALADFAYDPMELLTACKRLVERRPACGPLVWVCARMLSGSDPVTEAYDTVAALERDRTSEELAHAVPTEASVLVVGSAEVSSVAALWRPDIELMMASDLPRAHQRDESEDQGSDEGATAWPLANVDLLILEAEATGEGEALLRLGASAAAAAAHQLEIPVWLVAGLGRVLLDRMWMGARDLAVHADRGGRGYHDLEVASLDFVDMVVGPAGPHPVTELRFRRECPIVPELFA